jgi:hypothetical protein
MPKVRMRVAAAIIVLACAGCGASPVASSSGTPAVAPSPSPTVSSCEATVLALLGESGAALENGDQGGLDTVSVIEKYGAGSAVYRAFIALDGDVLNAEEQNGNTGLLTPFVSQAAALCTQYQGTS